MNAQAIINSAAGVGAALIIARMLPPRLGYAIASMAAAVIAKRKSSSLVRSVRTNQWIVSGKKFQGNSLDKQVKTILKNTSRCIYDFYHNIDQPDKVKSIVSIPSNITEYFTPHKKRNALFAAIHLSNFDLMGQALSLNGYHFQILSAPDPGSGYQWQNKIRKSWGHDITPASMEALQQAKKRLQSGGNVLTGIDRPISPGKYRPNFFGHPSALPVAYTRLALQTNTPVVVVSSITQPDGSYRLFISDPIYMKSMEDQTKETLRNTEAVLEIVEQMILQYPDQWSMYYPVWPEQMDIIN